MEPRPPAPSPFFRRLQLQQSSSHAGSGLPFAVRRRRRLVAAAVATIAFVAIASAGAILLAGPRAPAARQWWRHRAAPAPPVTTTAVTNEPGTVDLQVQKGQRRGTYRVRKVGEAWVIEDVSPKRPAKASRLPWRKPRTVSAER